MSAAVTIPRLRPWMEALIFLTIIALAALAPGAEAQKKNDKKTQETAQPQPPPRPKLDTRKLVWPSPPDVARIKWVTQVSGQEDLAPPAPKPQKKRSWMDRLAGISPTKEAEKKAIALAKPFGVAADSKGRIYAADTGHACVFVFDLERKLVEFLPAESTTPIALTVDDADRVFVVDSRQRRLSVFSPTWELEGSFGEDKLERPVGVAIDNENRFLYVVDVDAGRLAVFDADKFTFLRYLGKRSDPLSPEPGTFSYPIGVAVDADGNVYVTDTMNDRVQVFDADGEFIRMFGKQGITGGTFMRAKGIAVDADGHIYVTDAEFNNVQVFDQEGRVLAAFGTRGTDPGQFSLITGIFVDQRNRIIVADQWQARVQVFHYVTDAEAEAELKARGQAPTAAQAARNPASPQ